jgi:hypothetical protein
MVPIVLGTTVTNPGVNWTLVAYTVPAGRIFCLDFAAVGFTAVVAPTLLEITAPAGRRLLRQVPVINAYYNVRGEIWLLPGNVIGMNAAGGDAATDYVWALSGRLYDWTDFTGV